MHHTVRGQRAEHGGLVGIAGAAECENGRIPLAGDRDGGARRLRVRKADNDDPRAAHARKFHGIGLGDVGEETRVAFLEQAGDGLGVEFDDHDGNAQPRQSLVEDLADGTIAAENGVVVHLFDALAELRGGAFRRRGNSGAPRVEFRRRGNERAHQQRGKAQRDGSDGEDQLRVVRRKNAARRRFAAQDDGKFADARQSRRRQQPRTRRHA